jgi:hypothetical protein
VKKILNETHPEICKSWHPTKNTLKPSDVSYGSKIKVWWKCPQGEDHEWQSSVACHVKYPGCPICSGQKVIISTSLATKRPEIAAQWHPALNQLPPTEVTEFSARKIWWQCNQGHIWEARIFSRTQGAGCPYCGNKKADIHNSIVTTHPEIAKDWHPTLNGDIKPENVVFGSGKKVWWKCPKNHEYQARVTHRVNGGKKKQGTGCPYCVGQLVDKNNCLATVHPNIAKEWHPIKNGTLTPEQVVPMSHKKAWWQCPKVADHVWKASVDNRVDKNTTCPCCLGRVVVPSNCLATTHPAVAKEWHPTKNTITPNDITFANNNSFWWICAKKHEWKARTDARTRGTGCPYCASSKGEKKIKEILDMNKISYVTQYRFPDCINKRTLPFDFAIFNEGKVIGVIEFQGRQHFYPISYFGGEQGHKMTNKNDIIKFNYCKDHSIPLLSVPFWNLSVIENNLKLFIKILL